MDRAPDRMLGTKVLILSQFRPPSFAIDSTDDHPAGAEYLLKARAGDVPTFVAVVRQVAAGGGALGPGVIPPILEHRDLPDAPFPVRPRERLVSAVLSSVVHPARR